MQSLRNGITITLLSSFLFACGSGGGGGSDGSSGGGFIDPATCVLPSNVVTITAANAQLITSEVVGAIQSIQAFADASGSFIEFNGSAIAPNPSVFNCQASGTVTITLTDNDMSTTVTAGDLLSSLFSSCDVMPEVINGLFNSSLNTVNGAGAGLAASANNWDFNISGMANNLRINDNNINAAADGDATADVDFTLAGAALASTATSTMLTFSDNTGQCASVQNASIVSSAPNVTSNPSIYTTALNQAGDMVVASTSFSGVVNVPAQLALNSFSGMENYIDPMTGDYGQFFSALDNPDSGVLVINGFNGSSITLTVSMGGNVQIDVDEDGVAGFEATIMTTWAAL